MKKLNLFSLIVAALISACTNEPQMESSGDDPSAKALTTKAEQLITKAQQARALFYPSQSRSVSTDATIELWYHVTAAPRLTRSSLCLLYTSPSPRD